MSHLEIDKGENMSQANIDRLKKEGLLEEPIGPDERAKLDKLSDQEVDALISVKAKLGEPVQKSKIKPLCL
jgi:hypothetical protein